MLFFKKNLLDTNFTHLTRSGSEEKATTSENPEMVVDPVAFFTDGKNRGDLNHADRPSFKHRPATTVLYNPKRLAWGWRKKGWRKKIGLFPLLK